MGQSHQDLVGKLISLEDFKIQDRDPDALPKQWKDAAKSERPTEFRILLYHPEDTSFYLELDSKYGAFKDSTAAELGCSENGTWIDADALKDPEKILTRLKEHAQEKKEKEEQMATAKRAEEIAARKLAEKELNSQIIEKTSHQNDKEQTLPQKEEKNSVMTNENLVAGGVRLGSRKIINGLTTLILQVMEADFIKDNGWNEKDKNRAKNKQQIQSMLQTGKRLLKTDLGKAMMNVFAGWLLTQGKGKLQKYLPQAIGVGAEVLAEEMRNEAAALGMEVVLDKTLEIVSPSLAKALADPSNVELAKAGGQFLEELEKNNDKFSAEFIDQAVSKNKKTEEIQNSPAPNARTVN